MHLTNTTANTYDLNATYTLAPNASAYLIADADYTGDTDLRGKINELLRQGIATSSDVPGDPDAVARAKAANATQGITITKSDTTVYSPPLTSLYVGGAGNVAVLLVGDTTPVTLTAPAVGTHIRGLAIQKVMSTNTTATLLVGFR